MSDYCTRADGWEAIWQIHHGSIRILLVSNVSDTFTLLSPTMPDNAPDLVQMREDFPKLSPLWDAIRERYWEESLCLQTHPPHLPPTSSSRREILETPSCGDAAQDSH